MSTKPKFIPPPGPGRPQGSKGIVQQIRELTNNGQEIVGFFYENMNNPKNRTQDRAKCAEWLGDRFFGKASQSVLVGTLTDSERSQAAAHLADAELETLARAIRPLPLDVQATLLPLNPSEPLKKPTD